jgi:peptidoglycan/LPS O-acetylase OafA/YrhL
MIIICLVAFHGMDAFFEKVHLRYHSYFIPLQILLMAIELLPCWLLGVIIAEQIDDLKHVTYKSVVIYRFLVFFGSWCCSVGKFHFHIWYMASMNIFALLLFKWIEAEITYFKHNLPNPMLEKMGNFSYSVYLCHHTVYVAFGLLLYANFYTYPLLILITIVISFFFYLFIEKPSHLLARKINRKFKYEVL